MTPFVDDIDLIAKDIRRQSVLIREALPWFRSVSHEASKVVRRASRVYLVGCGDSYDVCFAAQFTWQRLLDVPVQAMTALTFSRYEVNTAPSDSLVVALSQSGKVSRVIEAARLAQGKGINTVTVTGASSSPLAFVGDFRLVTPFQKLGSIPGTSSYTYNLALVLELGAALAEGWGRPAGTDQVRDQLDSLPGLIDDSLVRIWPIATNHAEATALRETVHIALASGPNLPTVRFFARKAFEIPQLVVMAQESEEFAHDQYSIVGKGSAVLMCCPPGAAAGRDDELLISLASLNTTLAVVTDETRILPQGGQPTWRYDVAGGLDEPLTPLLYALPAQVYVYEIAKLVGGSFYGFADPIHHRDGDLLIYGSAMVDDETSR